MEKICFTNIGNLKIEGIQNDYVFETIRKSGKFYENDILLKWLPYICKSKIILDIGANLGNHTLFWSEHLDYEKIYSFEPFTPNFERLINNVRIHNKKPNIFTVKKGIGSKKGYTNIKEFHEDNYGGTTLATTISDNGEIEITDIDSFVTENHLNQIDFVKIDTEGFEENVLSGMENTLSKYYPDLWIEISCQSFHGIIQKLQNIGYILVDIDGFNLLFLHKSRHDNTIQSLKIESILDTFFFNLERVNKYYQNYEISKQWLASKDDKLKNLEASFSICKEKNELLSKRLIDVSEKYKSALNNYETTKTWISEKNKKLEELQKTIDNLNSELELVKSQHQHTIDENRDITSKAKKMTLQLIECYKNYDINIMNAEQIAGAIRKLEIQNSALVQQNSEIQSKLDIIDNSKIGRLGIKVYGFYKKYLRKQR